MTTFWLQKLLKVGIYKVKLHQFQMKKNYSKWIFPWPKYFQFQMNKMVENGYYHDRKSSYFWLIEIVKNGHSYERNFKFQLNKIC